MTRYSAVAIGLHWLIAAAIVALVAMGMVMTGLPDTELALKFSLYQWHKSVGITVLLLSLVRLAWRLTHRPPPLPAALRPWERAAARITHVGFYVLIVTIPLLGWAMVSASPYDIPTVLYGEIPWPHLPVAKAGFEALRAGHVLLAFGAVGLLALHVAAALKHHFILKDDVLARMLPFLRREVPE
ncbi:MAG: cytochrome b [Sphingomonadales bacterium]